MSPPLHILTKHPRRPPSPRLLQIIPIAALIVDELEIEGVDVARKIAETGQEDVDQQIDAAAGDEEDADRGDYGGKGGMFR